MKASKLREKFLNYFKTKGHQIVPSASLIPENDPTSLFISAGMQQFKPYFLGDKDPSRDFGSQRLASVQKCIRTSDIGLIGDDTHLTFFEMLGNFSIDDYSKKEAIELAWQFLTKELKIDPERLWPTIFKGDNETPKDTEALELWQAVPNLINKVSEFDRAENWWGPAGSTGPCGPCSEIHYDLTQKPCAKADQCLPNCDCGRFTELWNLVFMEYFQDESGNLKPLPKKNIDTGMGLERLVMVIQGQANVFATDLFLPIISELEKMTEAKELKSLRIIADHLKAAVFLAAEGILPSNLERGYILRRLLRRLIRYGKALNLPKNFLVILSKKVVEIYPELGEKAADILTIIQNEEEKFARTLVRGLKEFEKISQSSSIISGEEAFHLYDTYGFPLELTEELAQEKGIKVDVKGFKEAFKKHQGVSRAGAEKKFGGVGSVGAKGASLHTATHLLHQALREVLGKEVRQMGSDITEERLRFDFSFPRKLTEEEKKKIEELVNQKIKEDLPVEMSEMDYEEAIKTGALSFFKEKYGQKVKVYSIGDYSKEICAGPHVQRTGSLGRFKIISEKSSSAGTRRIKAVLEN